MSEPAEWSAKKLIASAELLRSKMEIVDVALDKLDSLLVAIPLEVSASVQMADRSFWNALPEGRHEKDIEYEIREWFETKGKDYDRERHNLTYCQHDGKWGLWYMLTRSWVEWLPDGEIPGRRGVPLDHGCEISELTLSGLPRKELQILADRKPSRRERETWVRLREADRHIRLGCIDHIPRLIAGLIYNACSAAEEIQLTDEQKAICEQILAIPTWTPED